MMDEATARLPFLREPIPLQLVRWLQGTPLRIRDAAMMAGPAFAGAAPADCNEGQSRRPQRTICCAPAAGGARHPRQPLTLRSQFVAGGGPREGHGEAGWGAAVARSRGGWPRARALSAPPSPLTCIELPPRLPTSQTHLLLICILCLFLPYQYAPSVSSARLPSRSPPPPLPSPWRLPPPSPAPPLPPAPPRRGPLRAAPPRRRRRHRRRPHRQGRLRA